MGFISNVHKYRLLRPTRSASFFSFWLPNTSGDPELRLLAQPPLFVTPIPTNIMVPSFNQSCHLSGPANQLKTCSASKLKSLSMNTGKISRQTVPVCPRNQDEHFSFTWLSLLFRQLIQFNLFSNSSFVILLNIFNTVPANTQRWFWQTDSKGPWLSKSARAVDWPEISGDSLKLKIKSFTPILHEQVVLFRRLADGSVSPSSPPSSSLISFSSSLILFLH